MTFLGFATVHLSADSTSDSSSTPTLPIPLEKCPSHHRFERIYLRHSEGSGVGFNQAYSTLGLFLSPSNSMDSYIAFYDFRGHVFNNGKYAANANFGGRFLGESSGVLGWNMGYDYRGKMKNHHQAALGLEYLFTRLEMRLNGYIPVWNRKKHVHLSKTNPPTKGYEISLKGVDAELGFHLIQPKYCALYVGVGPYYYHGWFGQRALGGRARVYLEITPYLTIEGIDTYDNMYGNRVQGLFSLNIPFGRKASLQRGRVEGGCDSAYSIQHQLVQPLQRQEIVAVKRHRKHIH